MSNIKILVVEDDPLYALDLKILMDELEYELVGVVDNSEEVFEVVEKNNPDIILMDISIKGSLNGIEVAERLQAEREIAIIFITSFDDRAYYEKVKKTTHYGYLIKPFSKITLESTIELAIMALSDDSNGDDAEENDQEEWNEDLVLRDCVFIKRNNRLEKVLINQIIFIQSEGNYCVITTEKKKYALKMSLIKVKQMLDTYPFARVNKRHIVNMNLISMIDFSTNQVNIDDASFTIGRTYKEGLLKRLKTLS